MSWGGSWEKIQNWADGQEANTKRSVLLSHCFKKQSHEKISTSWNLREMQIKAQRGTTHTGQNGLCWKAYKQ